jgi:hypothetical protein
MNSFLWSQILAGGALACGLVSYQCRERRGVLTWLTGLALLNAAHFWLLDRSTPALMLLLTATRYATALCYRPRWLQGLFLAVAVAGVAGTFSGPLSWLVLTAVLAGTLGSFQQSDQVMRLCFMIGNTCWLLHNLLAGTPVATLMEAAFLTSNITGYWRIYGRIDRRPPPPPRDTPDQAKRPLTN